MKKPPLRKVTFKTINSGVDEKGRPVWGLAYFDDHHIEIDRNLRNASKLNTLAHELFHIYHPEASERRVNHFGNELERIAKRMNLIREDD
jgi:predicted SprT family Zn-dependent metalloprotease